MQILREVQVRIFGNEGVCLAAGRKMGRGLVVSAHCLGESSEVPIRLTESAGDYTSPAGHVTPHEWQEFS